MNKLSTERAIEALYTVRAYYASLTAGYPKGKDCKGIDDVTCSEIANSCLMAIKALEQEPRKGEWLRMSDLSEEEDNRYQCSRCRNVVHYKDKMNLYTFNSWCGRCGSDNGRKIEVEL